MKALIVKRQNSHWLLVPTLVGSCWLLALAVKADNLVPTTGLGVPDCVCGIVCPSDITVNTDLNLCTAVVNYTVTVTDPGSCMGGAYQTAGLPSGSAFPLGVTLNTHNVDGPGGTQSCSFNVTVQDMQAPTFINCPADIVTNAQPISCNILVFGTNPTATDNCGVPTMVSSHLFPAVFSVGTTPVTHTATDAAGNVSICAFTVTVNDVTPPSIFVCGDPDCDPPISECPLDIVTNTDPGICTATVTWDEPTLYDNCAVTTINIIPANGSNFLLGTTIVSYFVADAAGNSEDCTFNVTVNDAEAPTIAGCPANIAASTNPGVCEAAVFWAAPNASDNCGIATFTSNFSPGDVFPLGTTTVTYTATDNAGLTATCTFNVTVSDNENPAITGCPANVMANTGPGVCSAVVAWAVPTAADNCGIATFTSTHLPGATFPLGVTAVTYTATDNAGLTATCTFNVTVADAENPAITGCPASFGVSTDPGLCGAAVFWAVPNATDNCGIALFNSTHNSGDIFHWELQR